MTKEELNQKLQFLNVSQIEKTMAVYVTVPDGQPQLFNIMDDDVEDLKGIIISSLISQTINNNDNTLEIYSTSLKRENALYEYDLNDESRTVEMKNMASVLNGDNVENYNVGEHGIEKINGIYIVIRGNIGQNVVIYKSVSTVDKVYSRSSFLIFKSNDQFRRQKESLLRISPSIQMFLVDNHVILVDMKKLEKVLKLDSILQRETMRDIQRLVEKNLIVEDRFIKNACTSPMMCKKLRHALMYSKVITKNIPNAAIIEFVRSKGDKLKLHFNRGDDKFMMKSKAEAVRFIKLLDDDFLHSELSDEDYDSDNKDNI